MYVPQNNIIVGYSGHAYVVADALKDANISLKYYSEKCEQKINPFNLEYIGDESASDFVGWGMNLGFIIGIGNNLVRDKIGLKIAAKNQKNLNVIHPSAFISSLVNFGEGIFISKGVLINTLVTINDFVIINTGCIIEHECSIGRSAHIAPGAVLSGNVSIGTRTFIGANAVIKEGVNIGDDVIVGAGSVVIRDIVSGEKFAGNPARKI